MRCGGRNEQVLEELPLPLGEGWGEGFRHAPYPALTLALSQRERGHDCTLGVKV